LPARALALSIGAIWAAPALAGMLSTEDAVVLDRAACEWETTAVRLSHTEEPRQDAWQTQLGCGTGARAQVSAAFGRSKNAGDEIDAAGGSAKVRLWGGGDGQAGLALLGSVNLLRVGDGEFRIHENAATLAFSQPLTASWTWHANLGTVYDREQRTHSTNWNLAAERAFGERFSLGAELFGDDRGTQWASVGAAWTPIENATLFVSGGAQLRGEGQEARLFSAGLTLAF
jgi:hypothetical protein